MNIRTDSTEYIYSSVTADHDLAGKTIEVALPVKNLAPTTWYTADVETVSKTSSNPDRWTATFRVLVGPSGGVTTLPEGSYDFTLKLTDSPEIPVRKAGAVTVTLT